MTDCNDLVQDPMHCGETSNRVLPIHCLLPSSCVAPSNCEEPRNCDECKFNGEVVKNYRWYPSM